MPKEVVATLLLHDSLTDAYLVCHATQSSTVADQDDHCWTIPKGVVDDPSPRGTLVQELLEVTGVDISDVISNVDLQHPLLTLPSKKRTLHVFRVSRDRLSEQFPADEMRCTKTIAPPSPLQGLPEMDGFRWVGQEEASRLVAANVKPVFDTKSECSPPASPTEGGDGRRRVLLLHGWGQSAVTFEKRTKVLKKKLEKSGIEAVYAQAPHVVPGFNGEEADPRGWWYYNEADRGDYSCIQNGEGGLAVQVAPVPFLGLADSLAELSSLWRNHGPFEGLLAFSQGACMASMVAKRAETDATFRSLKYVVLISGFWLQADGEDWYSGYVALPSLHVMGQADAMVPEALNRQLADHYPTGEVFCHPGGHSVPQNAENVSRYLRFIERFTGRAAL